MSKDQLKRMVETRKLTAHDWVARGTPRNWELVHAFPELRALVRTRPAPVIPVEQRADYKCGRRLRTAGIVLTATFGALAIAATVVAFTVFDNSDTSPNGVLLIAGMVVGPGLLAGIPMIIGGQAGMNRVRDKQRRAHVPSVALQLRAGGGGLSACWSF